MKLHCELHRLCRVVVSPDRKLILIDALELVPVVVDLLLGALENGMDQRVLSSFIAKILVCAVTVRNLRGSIFIPLFFISPTVLFNCQLAVTLLLSDGLVLSNLVSAAAKKKSFWSAENCAESS